MRTTNNMLINNMMFNLKTNMERLSKYQTQMATGKKISIPSDDPIVASKALKFRTDVSQVTQFQSNAKDATSWMEITEDTLGKMGDITQTIYSRAVQAANTGTMTSEDRDKIRQEVTQLRDQLIHLGNTSYAGRYIFSGHDTDSKLLNEDGTYATSVSSHETAIISGGLLQIPVTIDATNNTFDISLTGGGYKTVTLTAPIPATYSSADDLAADIQNSIIAADPAAFKDIQVKSNNGRLEFSLRNTTDANGNNLQIYLRKGTNDLLDAVKVKTDIISGITVSKSEDINYQLGIGDMLNVNVVGTELFGSGVKGDVGEVVLKLNNFIDSLSYTDDKSYIRSQTLKADSLNTLNISNTDEFSITIDGTTYSVTLSANAYDGSAGHTLNDLALDIGNKVNAAVNAGGFNVTVKNDNGRIVMSEDSGKKITLTEGGAGVDALRKLKIYTGTNKTVTSFTGAEGLDKAISDILGINDKILNIRADIGARMNRSELTLNRLDSDELNFTKLMSDNEDIDMAEVIMNLTNEENVYKASLAGSARIIMPSLVDFLR